MIAARITDGIDRRIVMEYFSRWRIAQRALLLNRVRQDRFLAEAFEIWRERYQGIHGVLDPSLLDFQKRRNLKLLRDAFELWRESSEMLEEQYEIATVPLSFDFSNCSCITKSH
jgi:Sfi1 spindle body protein